MLDVKNISYSISNRKLFENASFSIPSGYHVGLVGKNGIGKTTLFNLIDKNLLLDEGEINLQKRKKISVLQQEIPNTNLSILDYVLSTDYETQLLIEIAFLILQKCRSLLQAMVGNVLELLLTILLNRT